ncbi:AraC-like DNA-binding protein [Paenibacillus castaneae]|uniref:AraC family transcriptional regulator n=1 Tax=Paenibacillus castaneae TaxID=474957 RepID=UPI00141B7047|nr:helix-turn-helix transcriptional regulator [Paenibacillus castaneae]NIK75159.1 AraC-like DNA-binding protein [Paenibacillus castaneae]
MAVKSVNWQSQTYPNRKIELYLHGMHMASVGSGMLCDRHLHHRMLELNLVLEGSQTAIIGSQHYVQQTGDLIAIPPMRLHEFMVQPFEEAKFFVIHIQNVGRQLMQLLSKSETYLYPVGTELNDKIRPVLLRLIDLLQENGSQNRIMHACAELLIQLEEDLNPDVMNDALPQEEHNLAEQIAREIEVLTFSVEPWDEEIQPANWLEVISQKLGISRRHCHRVFQQAYRMSPRQYFSIIRQQEAMHMLLGSSETVEKIAHRIGFENAQSFIRQFTKWTGMTPGAFRKKEHNNLNYLTPLELARE